MYNMQYITNSKKKLIQRHYNMVINGYDREKLQRLQWLFQWYISGNIFNGVQDIKWINLIVNKLYNH